MELQDEQDRIDRELNIIELKQRAAELSGGQMVTGGSENVPPEISEAFWQNVVRYEEAPWTTHLDQLARHGVVLPPPEYLDDEHLPLKLWEVIRALAELRVFLHNTDHLSDRELYDYLWREGLREQVKDLPMEADSAYHLDMTGSGSEEDITTYLRYYADSESRQCWMEEFPDDPIPPKEKPPYSRDRTLPQAYEDAEEDEDFESEEDM